MTASTEVRSWFGRIGAVLALVAGRLYTRTDLLLTRAMLRYRYGMPANATRLIHLDEVGAAGEERHGYLPSPWGILQRILPPEEVSTDDVFLEIGCGMGTVLLEAGSRYPFRRLIGVDVAQEFTAVARDVLDRNLDKLRCHDFDMITADARNFEVPDDVTVIYMHDPFSGATFRTTIENLIASVDRRPRRVRIIYLAARDAAKEANDEWPADAAVLRRTDRARFVRYGRRRLRPWAGAEYLLLYEVEARTAATTDATSSSESSE